MWLVQEETHAGKMLRLGCACVIPTSKDHNVISVCLDTMGQIASLASVQALVSMRVLVTVRLASVFVVLDLKATCVIGVLQATSITRYVSFVAAAPLGPCQKVVAPPGDATAGMNTMVFIVTNAALDIIPTLTAKHVLVILVALWTVTVVLLASAVASQTTWAIRATSAPQVSMDFLPAQLVTAP